MRKNKMTAGPDCNLATVPAKSYIPIPLRVYNKLKLINSFPVINTTIERHRFPTQKLKKMSKFECVPKSNRPPELSNTKHLKHAPIEMCSIPVIHERTIYDGTDDKPQTTSHFLNVIVTSSNKELTDPIAYILFLEYTCIIAMAPGIRAK